MKGQRLEKIALNRLHSGWYTGKWIYYVLTISLCLAFSVSLSLSRFLCLCLCLSISLSLSLLLVFVKVAQKLCYSDKTILHPYTAHNQPHTMQREVIRNPNSVVVNKVKERFH